MPGIHCPVLAKCRAERVAVLLAGLFPGLLDSEAVQHGMFLLVQSVDDLAIDVPEAPSLLALFLARAVLDEILPPKFLQQLQELDPENVGVAAAAALKGCARHRTGCSGCGGMTASSALLLSAPPCCLRSAPPRPRH
eukprot:SAG22_NODE_4145_length_1368_cov_1.371946_2_plen_137_part_00